ncbi:MULTISPECIES: DUF3037 domain-containing protein [Pseudonocardia]|uniref:DUF3037 domain-containing protein n=1 Tax=Pseudonocardia oroxyli TaxID=366584 RepID=A0A1G7ZUH7_PSEOR|nr:MULTISPECIES: DUF3037 domain-containing protein [Pseudonocardia]MCF7548179.1 DUF3037 domain-containing protein [Pseudonocardia sp. WMMC193]SDH12342.1 Protein of unknown function [Pseudonocardia oroxyli]
MSRVLYEYAVLQVVPRPERGETINAGVLVYCRARDFLGGAVHLDRARLAALDPHADADAITDLLETVVAVCAVPDAARADRRTEGALAASGPGVGEDLGRRFRRLTAPRSTVVRPGPVHSGLTLDPALEPDRLLKALVH